MRKAEYSHAIDEQLAASLLGLSLPEVRWYSRLLGVGHAQVVGQSALTVFTDDELQRLALAAASSDK